MLIDLTAPLRPDTPVYPGDPKMEIIESCNLEKDGFHDNVIKTGTHLGTHIDAPAHMLRGGKTLDAFAVNRLHGRGVLIDARDGFHDQIENAGLEEGDIALVWTDWSKRYSETAYFEDYKALPDSWAQAFVDAKISIVGLDQCSPDHPPFDIHKLLLGSDVLICENLMNLEQLEGKEFRVWALPLNLAIDGSPTRVVAEVA